MELIIIFMIVFVVLIIVAKDSNKNNAPKSK